LAVPAVLHLTSLVVFSLIGALSPGPNNIMLMTSGVNFGLRASGPHVAGVWLGVTLVQLLIGAGFYALLQAFPWLYTALHLAALFYLLYLAWRMATATSTASGRNTPHPLTFLQAAAFQCVNPKVWAVGLAAITTFARPDHVRTDVVVIALTIGLVSVPCLVLWTAFGTVMRHALSTPKAVRFFNVAMAILLVLSLLPVLLR
jgi:threonine/homoserine/homoserine lactone efflux protein